MISAEIREYDQYAQISDGNNDDPTVFDRCKNIITFDCEGMIISSTQMPEKGCDDKEQNDLCTIFFKITPKFVKELKALVAAIDAAYDDA